MKRSRAERRHFLKKAKDRARRIIKIWNSQTDDYEEPSAERIGREASVHCKGCDCYMCNPERLFGREPTIQERKAEEDFKAQIRYTREENVLSRDQD